MQDLPPYVAGSADQRQFAIGGHSLFVGRSWCTLEVGFPGIGRDGDHVPPDAPEPAVLAALLAGIAGIERIEPGGAPSFRVDSPEVLAVVERRLVAAAGGYASISRTVSRSATPAPTAEGLVAVAAALFAIVPEPGMQRTIYLCEGHALTITVPALAEPSAYEWMWGRAPGTWLPDTLRALGVLPVRIGGSDAGKVFQVPRLHLTTLLDRALVEFGASDVRVRDAR